MLDREVTLRADKRIRNRLASAKLRFAQACIEDIDFAAARGLRSHVVPVGIAYAHGLEWIQKSMGEHIGEVLGRERLAIDVEIGAPLVTDPAEAGSAGKEPADGDTDRLGRRLVAAVLRELVGRGVTRIGIAEGVTGCLSDELRGLGFAPVLGSTTWEAVGAG